MSKYDPLLLRSMAEIVIADLKVKGTKSKKLIERMNREHGYSPEKTVDMLYQYAAI